MTQEKDRLLNMLQEKKISEEEYRLLSSAMVKKPALLNTLFSLLTNPFQKMAGFRALTVGFAVMILMSILGVIAKVYFMGILSCLNASVIINPKYQLNFTILFLQNLICWSVLSLLFLIAAKLFQQKRLRTIDFFGTVALARFPYLIIVIIVCIMRITHSSLLDVELTKGYQFKFSWALSLFGTVMIIAAIWQIVTYFYALKESSGLSGKKLWISFIAAIVLGEMITNVLTMLIVTL